MRYLGIDYGTKRIGIALSDASGSFAFPQETIPNDYSTIDRIKELSRQEGVGAIVIGDARALNGGDNPVTAEVTTFAKSLNVHTHLPVHTSWEAGSSVEAARFAPKGQEHNDAAAAAIILQRYLDAHQGGSTS